MATATRSAHRQLSRVAARQYGLFARSQARWCGFSDDQVDRRIGTGVFATHRPGVLVVAGAPPSWEQVALGGVLACGPGAYAAGPTGARIWETSPCPSATANHVLTASGERRSRRPGIIGHRSSIIEPSDLSRRKGIDVTSPARTLADCAVVLGVEGLASALDDAMRRDLLTLEAMRGTSARLLVPGRRHRTIIAAVLASRLPGYDPGDSDLEIDGLTRIRRAGLATPVQQHPVMVDGRLLHIDLAYPDLMIGIELDGWEWHRHRVAFDRDRHRTSWLSAAGWAMLSPTSQTIGDLVPQLRLLMPRRAQLLPSLPIWVRGGLPDLAQPRHVAVPTPGRGTLS